jgi:hypothetical protein
MGKRNERSPRGDCGFFALTSATAGRSRSILTNRISGRSADRGDLSVPERDRRLHFLRLVALVPHSPCAASLGFSGWMDRESRPIQSCSPRCWRRSFLCSSILLPSQLTYSARWPPAPVHNGGCGLWNGYRPHAASRRRGSEPFSRLVFADRFRIRHFLHTSANTRRAGNTFCLRSDGAFCSSAYMVFCNLWPYRLGMNFG